MTDNLLETNISSCGFISKNIHNDICQSNFLLDISKNNYDLFGNDVCNIIQFYQSHGVFVQNSTVFSIGIYKSDIESFNICSNDSKIIIFLDVSSNLLFYQTDLTYEEYKYKQFTEKYKLWISMVENQNMIYINKNDYSKGFCKLQENTHEPITWIEITQINEGEDIPPYSKVTLNNTNSRTCPLFFKQIHFVTVEQDSIVTPDVFNTLLYYKTIEHGFIENLQKGVNKLCKHFYIEDSNTLQQNISRSKFQNDCKVILQNHIHENINRFIHVGYIPRVLDVSTCKWCFQTVSKTKTKSLQNFPYILNMLSFSFHETLLPYIKTFFAFPLDYKFENVHMNIIQSESIKEIPQDENFLIHIFVKISNTTSLLEFKENVVYSISEGDALFMHSSKRITNNLKKDLYLFLRF